jgi:serine/threonine protein kinase
MVMELVRGETLDKLSERLGPLPPERAASLIDKVLSALEHAHRAGIVHRDMKPANVMLLPSGSVKVMDFGLARRATDMSSNTTAGEIVGTIAYLPPERFLGKAADARSDLYSVGVMMYETFTGQVPFKSETDDLVAVIFGHVNEPPPTPRSVNRAVPMQVERIIMRLLEKEPDRRYQTAVEVIADLRTLLGPSSGAVTDPGLQRGQAPSSAPPTAADAARKTIEADAREVLARTFGKSRPIDVGYSETLAGMLASRKGDWAEASRAYQSALSAFAEAKNEIECAKTALKYAGMVLQKNTEAEGNADRREVSGAIDILTEALPSFRGRSMLRELEEGERLLYALQRVLIRNR